MRYFALVDCNSFYCSCERVFRPDTRGRPIIVLSNNDGCAISFSKEARECGFGQMADPFYKLKDKIKEHNVAVFSSNYALYDDMSTRVMRILNGYTDGLEVYSVDEAFLSLEGESVEQLQELGKKIREDILTQTGLPVGVGISKTKVLAKLANRMSKKSSGVCVFIDDQAIDEALKAAKVKDIWGIGKRTSVKLNMLGIKTAYDFKMHPDEKLIQKMFTKTGREIQDELRGISCLPVEHAEDKKNTGTSRSFGIPVYDKKELREALAYFVTHSAMKLRKQGSVCYGVMAYVHTNPFKGSPQYYGEGKVHFTSGTADTLKIIQATHNILEEIYRPGYEYKKAGVLLTHIVPKGQNQMDIFAQGPQDNECLNQVMDLINQKYGAHTIKSAACGLDHSWKTICDYKSQHYTTQWDEILRVKIS